ncbi:hypothetical protein CAPTEDRAFT_216666 [Capitella teleta]|uniref:CUB domain-containing protein n=1 Tax=Capitella teleta TaxID=283909 RepID=R7TB30_CAPTE|nr:hypothetical protein CAPTEDRAFT_216666 [Capitella teleta]|eukprot:ELT90712.1 hypothetical protein CAPTEDRAFT_216666 [Capitella teleta]
MEHELNARKERMNRGSHTVTNALIKEIQISQPLLAFALQPDLRCEEFCRRETFNGSCPDHHVIMVTTARYGRMHQGRCVKDLYIGCYADVLEFMDKLCSGKKSCNVPVRKLMDIAQPCPEDYTAFLTVTYTCIKVTDVTSNDQCAISGLVSIEEQQGYLQPPNFAASHHSAVGKPQCPFRIHVDPTQRISLTLLDFRPVSVDSLNHECPLHLVVVDGLQSDHQEELCEQRGRERALLTTQGNDVNIYFLSTALGLPTEAQFLLKYEAVGCRQLVVGDEFYVMDNGDDVAAVRCNATDETWYLTCRGNTWIGEVGNCTEGNTLWKEHQGQGGEAAFPYGILIAVIVGILLGILIGSLLLALVYGCFKRRRKHNPGQDAMLDPAVHFTSTPSEPTYPSLLKPGGQPNTMDYSSAYGYYPEPPPQGVLVGGGGVGGGGGGGGAPPPNTTSATKIDITAKLVNETPRRHDHVYESASLPGFTRFAVSGHCPGMAVPCTALGTLHQHRRCPEYYELETEEKGRNRQFVGYDCRSMADSPKK